MNQVTLLVCFKVLNTQPLHFQLLLPNVPKRQVRQTLTPVTWMGAAISDGEGGSHIST